MPHDHHHDDTSEHEQELSVANELIGYANSKLNEGMNPITIAAGLRHAAANFSAFASVHSDQNDLDVAGKTEEFQGMLVYYGERHGATVETKTGLEKLVESVKNE